ncbi:MAG: cob(I)yrinic acid a,c-diamide adenosyltransferase [Thermomicrobiales bacterium]|nr:cob(I)yrinic acid a,c-diamide adenosyltransferase [Thermomicrobiales bacterium]
MRYYTGTGDQGTTDLLGDRVGKNDPIIEVLGALDEATSTIGNGRAHATSPELNQWLMETQRDLYRIMAELAFTDEIRPDSYHFSADRVEWLEQVTDEIGSRVQLPPHFVLPGDTIPGAALDVARTVVRRAERRAVDLQETGKLGNPEIVRYLNRLSSLLFMAARYEDHLAGVSSTKAKQDTDP